MERTAIFTRSQAYSSKFNVIAVGEVELSAVLAEHAKEIQTGRHKSHLMRRYGYKEEDFSIEAIEQKVSGIKTSMIDLFSGGGIITRSGELLFAPDNLPQNHPPVVDALLKKPGLYKTGAMHAVIQWNMAHKELDGKPDELLYFLGKDCQKQLGYRVHEGNISFELLNRKGRIPTSLSLEEFERYPLYNLVMASGVENFPISIAGRTLVRCILMDLSREKGLGRLDPVV